MMKATFFIHSLDVEFSQISTILFLFFPNFYEGKTGIKINPYLDFFISLNKRGGGICNDFEGMAT